MSSILQSTILSSVHSDLGNSPIRPFEFLDIALQQLRPFDGFNSITYFMNDPLKRYDFLEGVHDLAQHMFNFWKYNNMRSKAIIRVHPWLEKQTDHFRKRIKKKNSLIEALEGNIKKIANEIVKLKEEESRVISEEDMRIRNELLLKESTDYKLVDDYVTKQSISIFESLKSYKVMIYDLETKINQTMDDNRQIVEDLSSEIQNLTIMDSNLTSNLSNQLAQLETKCIGGQIMFDVVSETISKLIKQHKIDLLKNRYEVVQIEKIKEVYTKIKAINNGDKLFEINLNLIESDISDLESDIDSQMTDDIE